MKDVLDSEHKHLTARWKPYRSGLINLFKYEDEIFRFENGRLLLRGDNGSGKSRVLALQLPFLLDGDLSPYRVEPDRDAAKRMEWHLLMDRHEHRTGYTWIEFARLGDTGSPEFVTLGCGMDAQKGAGAPKRWFFVTSQRVGYAFKLVENRMPLTRRQLIDVFEKVGAGTVYEKSGEYRRAVDDALFKLGERYAPLIELLLQLRQPQLMRDMKEDVLSGALSEALPPVETSLIDSVAESFQALDGDRHRFEEHRSMLDTVETFCIGYRHYLAVAVRRLAAVLRTGQSTFENAARELRALEEKLDATTLALKVTQKTAAEAATLITTLDQRVHTLRDSPEMRSKRELEDAAHQAEATEGEAKTATIDLERATRDHTTATAECTRIEGAVAARSKTAATAHRALAAAHSSISASGQDLFSWPSHDLPTDCALTTAFIAARHKAVACIVAHNTTIARHQTAFDSEQRHLERRQSDVADATEAVTESGQALEAALDTFATATATWESRLTLLTPEVFPRGSDWSLDTADWLASDHSTTAPLARKLAAARDHVMHEIAATRSELATARSVGQAEADLLRAELAHLRQGGQPEPTAPASRHPRPADRHGAPFWKLCEFHDVVHESERAGWEAALESSGILDAWVYPDGRLATGTENDDFLVLSSSTKPADHPLSKILRPESEGIISEILARIGTRPEPDSCWVTAGGHWANGLCQGHWEKPSTEFLGHRAREAARLRRIGELEATLEEITRQLAALAEQSTALVAKEEALAAEYDAAPDTTLLVHANISLDQSRVFLTNLQKLRAEAETLVAKAQTALQEITATRDTDAADLGLTAHAAPDLLEAYAAALSTFEKQAITFWPIAERLAELHEDLFRAKERETVARETAAHREEHHNRTTERAARARSRADTLLAAVGSTVEQLMTQLAETEAGLRTAKADREAAEKHILELKITQARLEENRTTAQEKRRTSESDRDDAVGRMEDFVARRVFAEIGESYQPDRATFSPTAAVDLARTLEKDLAAQDLPAPEDDDTWSRLHSDIIARHHELGDQLGRHGIDPTLSPIDGGTTHWITCNFQQKDHTMGGLHTLLTGELGDRERLFQEREREIIENHLIGEAAISLQKRIREAETWVASANKQLETATTSSGIMLRFEWHLADPSDESLRGIRRHLLKNSATWSPAERDAIGGFLQERIRAAREEDDTVSWAKHLARALDYRAWHHFSIGRKQGSGDSWKKLTRRTFGTGSGGEKALTLTVPQFAAAAAHYASAGPHAPRLILLDEAFVAIDSATRSRLMGLLETFDLDYVMTSEREWGTYPTVSALAIYQLASRPDNPAVSVTRWIWNGKEKIRES